MEIIVSFEVLLRRLAAQKTLEEAINLLETMGANAVFLPRGLFVDEMKNDFILSYSDTFPEEKQDWLAPVVDRLGKQIGRAKSEGRYFGRHARSLAENLPKKNISKLSYVLKKNGFHFSQEFEEKHEKEKMEIIQSPFIISYIEEGS